MTAPEPAFAPTDSAPPYWLRILLVATIAGLLAMVLLFPFPLSARHWGELFNLAHAPAFFLAFLLVAGLFDPSCVGFPKSWQRILPLNTNRLIVLVSVLLVLGVTCEVLQGFVERSPSVSDVVANGCGLIAGAFWCCSRQRIAWGRIGLSMVVAGLLIAASWSPILELYDCYLQHQDFPLLASFERPRELHAWSAHEAIIDQSATWSTQGTASMRVQGSADTRHPGVNIHWPVSNWAESTALEMDVFNPSDKPLAMRISITDKLHAASGHAATDRYGTSVALPSAKHVHIRIDLADVQNAPASRQMDMTQIESLNLFVVRPEADVVFMVDNVRLVKD